MSNANSTPIDWPRWAGRLSAALDMMLEEPSSSIVAEIQRDIATQVRDEYEEAMGRGKPDSTVSPLGDRRENPVPCSVCRDETWNIAGRCDDHLEAVSV